MNCKNCSNWLQMDGVPKYGMCKAVNYIEADDDLAELEDRLSYHSCAMIVTGRMTELSELITKEDHGCNQFQSN